MKCEVCGSASGKNRLYEGVEIVICDACWKNPQKTTPSGDCECSCCKDSLLRIEHNREPLCMCDCLEGYPNVETCICAFYRSRTPRLPEKN